MSKVPEAPESDFRELSISPFWRSRAWLCLQATRRLSRRILASVPVLASAADRVSHRSWKPPGNEGYLRLFAKYWGHFKASGLDVERATVCEIGPGRTLDVSLMFALLGAKRAIAVDCERWASVEETVSGALGIAEQIPAFIECGEQEAAEIKRRAVNGDYELLYELGRAEDIPLPAGTADFIFSHSVLQHVGDLDSAFASMSRVLSPAGVAVHHIDLKDHGMLRSKNPLLMMQFPPWLWDLCTRNAPDAINRARLGRYFELASKHGLEARLLSSTVLERLPVPRRALAPEFRDLPDADLCTIAADILFRRIT